MQAGHDDNAQGHDDRPEADHGQGDNHGGPTDNDRYDAAVIDFVKRTGCGYFHIVLGPGGREYVRDAAIDPCIFVQGDLDDRELRIDQPADSAGDGG